MPCLLHFSSEIQKWVVMPDPTHFTHFTTSIKGSQIQLYSDTFPAVGPLTQLLSKPQPAHLDHCTQLPGTAVNTNQLMTSGTKCAHLKEESLSRQGKGVQGRGGTWPSRWGTHWCSGSIQQPGGCCSSVFSPWLWRVILPIAKQKLLEL